MRKPKNVWQGAVPDYEKTQTMTYKEYPQVVFNEYVDRNSFYNTLRIVEVADNVFRFEKSTDDDAMGNPVWKPLRDEEYKGVAEHLLKKLKTHTENAETTNE